MKKRHVAGAAGGLAAVCILLGSQFGLNFGGGGTGFGGNEGSVLEQEDTKEAQRQETESMEESTVADGDHEAAANVIAIRVVKDQVFVGDVEYKSPEELRGYIEDVYEDGKIVEVVDEQSILATYEWVQQVLEELKIAVVEKGE